ncbi:MAG: hypothetical protein J7M26_05700, partial [Armatimonadetes bacterium]|nr:hypothetical protein [Armatimonadota bacterium]
MTELSLLVAAALSVSLIVNGDFEQGLRNWSTRHGWYEQPKGAGLSEVTVAEGEGHDGGKALKIVGKNNRGLAMQVFEAYPGRYKVSGWIRCQGLGDARAGVLLEWMSGQGKWLRGDWAVQVSGDQGWKRFEATLQAHADTRSVHFDLLTTAPNSGTVWFDDIVCERVVGDLPEPVPPQVTAETPEGADGCLEVRWDPKALAEGTVRLLIYCEQKPLSDSPSLVPRVVAAADDGKAMVWSLEKGQRYFVAARAVNADLRASALGKPVEATPQDRQAPRPGWLSAERLADGRVRVGWSPHVLDLDVKTLHLVAPGEAEGKPRELK